MFKSKNQFQVIFLLTVLFFSSCRQTNLEKYFKGFEGTIIIYDQKHDHTTIHNEQRASTRFTPFSTHKIPHSLIALETGVVSNVDEFIQWDAERYPREDWWPSQWEGKHNLRSAIKYSVVPLYRELARKIGEQEIKRYLDLFDYGNADNSSGVDNYWLNGSLQISAQEQITFLKKFYNKQLKVSPKTIDAVKEILIQESTENYTISYKTGAGTVNREKGVALGWVVGYVERQDNVYFFALNIEGSSFSEVLQPRIDIMNNILREMDITC